MKIDFFFLFFPPKCQRQNLAHQHKQLHPLNSTKAKEQEEIYQLISQRCRQVNVRQDVQNFLKNLDQPNAINVSTINALKPKAYASPALGLVVDGQSVLSNVSVVNVTFFFMRRNGKRKIEENREAIGRCL